MSPYSQTDLSYKYKEFFSWSSCTKLYSLPCCNSSSLDSCIIMTEYGYSLYLISQPKSMTNTKELSLFMYIIYIVMLNLYYRKAEKTFYLYIMVMNFCYWTSIYEVTHLSWWKLLKLLIYSFEMGVICITLIFKARVISNQKIPASLWSLKISLFNISVLTIFKVGFVNSYYYIDVYHFILKF